MKANIDRHTKEIAELLAKISQVEENYAHVLHLAETYKEGWEKAEERVKELEDALTNLLVECNNNKSELDRIKNGGAGG
jgi:chromosome segregation ATPase